MILAGAAAATLLAAWFAPEDEGLIVSPAAATTRPARDPNSTVIAAQVAQAKAAGAQPPAIPIELQIQRRVAEEDLGNLFASQGWPTLSPLKPIDARAPQDRQAGAGSKTGNGNGAPALPFQFMGRFIDDGKAAYFLQMDDRNIVARVGEKVGDHYQLDGAANGTLTFTYLPLNLKQTLAVGDTN
jgi:hypothetical protein